VKSINKKRNKRKETMLAFGLLISITLIATAFSGCTQNSAKTTISLGGSTTVQPIADSAAAAFMKLHSNVTVEVYGGGSSVGIKGVAKGT